MAKDLGLTTKDAFLKEIQEKVPPNLIALLEEHDGAAHLAETLPKNFAPIDIATPSERQRAWELCGLYFLNLYRFHEALPIFSALYDQMLVHQESTGTYVHKGMPLVYISDCHARLDHPVLAKRYLMLTACEDAIRGEGKIAPTTGVYPRMVWTYGFSHQEVNRYASEIWDFFRQHPEEALFPEWILQEIDQEWMTDYPSPREAASFDANLRYTHWLLNKLGTGEGKYLERLAHDARTHDVRQ